MIFVETRIAGAFMVEPEPIPDTRGFFARIYDAQEFAARGLNTRWVQSSISFNHQCGTWRGLHYQADPYPEIKWVRCTRGAIYDVIVDMRADSPTFKQWIAVELAQANRRALYIPAHCAHGFLTLQDDTEVFYEISEINHSECARGVRWDDPALALHLPRPITVISEQDRLYPNLEA